MFFFFAFRRAAAEREKNKKKYFAAWLPIFIYCLLHFFQPSETKHTQRIRHMAMLLQSGWLVWSGPMQNNIITRDNLAQLHKTKRNPVKENRTVLQLYRDRQTDHQITTTYSMQFHT